MVVGEPQVLGQLRAALAAGQTRGTAGPVLNDLAQTALRVGKRAHSETGLDQAGQSVVTAALELAVPHLAGRRPLRACVVGAGSMSALATVTLLRQYPDLSVTVVNRTFERAERLAAAAGARALPFERLAEALADADLVISCTGSADTVLTADLIHAAGPGPRTVLDLALPRDVAPEVAELPGVTLIDLERIAGAEREAGARVAVGSVEAVRRIIAEEVAGYDAAIRAATVAPTVAALRGMAAGFVGAELARFDGRTAGLDPKIRAEVAQTVRRVVDKLLHEPTVRVRELANETGAVSYAAALAELFALDPEAVDAVTRPEGLT
jgi:glutamyl-tRNA reductase